MMVSVGPGRGPEGVWLLRATAARARGTTSSVPASVQPPSGDIVAAGSNFRTNRMCWTRRSRSPDGDVVDPEVLGRGPLGHVVVEADFVEPQVGRGTPAQVLDADLLHAVDPQLLDAVILARHDLLLRQPLLPDHAQDAARGGPVAGSRDA